MTIVFGMLSPAMGAGLEEEIAAGSVLVEIGADVRLSSVQRVDGELTITGPEGSQPVVEAAAGQRLFELAAGAKLTLKNLRLRGGEVRGDAGVAGLGGGIFVSAGSALILENVSIEGCTAIGGKGALPRAPGAKGGRGGYLSSRINVPSAAGQGERGGAGAVFEDSSEVRSGEDGGDGRNGADGQLFAPGGAGEAGSGGGGGAATLQIPGKGGKGGTGGTGGDGGAGGFGAGAGGGGGGGGGGAGGTDNFDEDGREHGYLGEGGAGGEAGKGGFGGGDGAAGKAGLAGGGREFRIPGAFAPTVFLGGAGGSSGAGGGGAAMGAAVFVETGGQIILGSGIRFSNNQLIPGEGGGDGAEAGRAFGIDLFLMPAANLEGIRPGKADIYVFDEQEISAGKEFSDSE